MNAPQFSGCERHECPDWAPCPVCQAIPLHLLGPEPMHHDDEQTLADMIDAGMIEIEQPDELKRTGTGGWL